MDTNEYRSQLPELGEFLSEFEIVLKNASKFNMPDVVWSANVLLSIDSGYDAPGVTVDIAKQMVAGGIQFKSTQIPAVQSFTLPKDNAKADLMWNQAFAFIEKCSIAERSSGKRIDDEPLIFCFDLSECLGQISGQEMLGRLKALLDIKGRFIYVFRVPYLEGAELLRVRSVISDIFPLRTLAIAPLGDEALEGYLRQRLEQSGIVVRGSASVDKVIGEMIEYEKSDGRFDGIATMNKLAESIVYLKLAKMTNPTKSGKAGAFRVDLTGKELLDIYAELKGGKDGAENVLQKLETPEKNKIGF